MKEKLKESSKLIMGKPIRKYRIIIQERKGEGDKIEKARSFMLYDYFGKSDIDKLKDKLSKRGVRFYK